MDMWLQQLPYTPKSNFNMHDAELQQTFKIGIVYLLPYQCMYIFWPTWTPLMSGDNRWGRGGGGGAGNTGGTTSSP